MAHPLNSAAARQGKETMKRTCIAVAQACTPPGTEIHFRKALSGRAWTQPRRMDVPHPFTRRSLQVYLHECAHIWLGHDQKGKPRHVEEMEAEQWSFAVMRAFGVAIPRRSRARAKAYVARKIMQAKRRGAKHIDPQAAKFAR